MSIEIQDLGRIHYSDAHTTMKRCLTNRIINDAPDCLLLCEHPPVYTVGRHRNSDNNVLFPGEVPVISVERGGDVTFHGLGQLVGYPIVQLPKHRQDLIAFLRGLEEFWIDLLDRHFSIKATRNPRNTGVWVGEQKLIAMGIACRKWTIWHGFSWNLTVDLDYYKRINPCGMGSETVTSMAVLGCELSIDDAKTIVKNEFPVWWEKWRAKLPETGYKGGQLNEGDPRC